MGGLIRVLVGTAMMGSVTGPTPLTPEKQKDGMRARVLDAAVAHFAAVGFSKPALDQITRAAGVDADDVAALFGSEDGLRRACDDHVLGALVGWAHQKATLAGMGDVMRSYTADPSSYRTQIDYLGRVMAENAPAAARFFDVLVDESETIIRTGISDGTMRPSDDPRALAALTAATVLGLLTMAPHIERALGLGESQQQMLFHLAVPALELFTHGLYTDDSYLSLVRRAVSFLPPTEHDRQQQDTPSQQDGI
ncbi:TetR/AcrR family transcriptional regulator [Arthrobacter sp. Y81]|uniref:TetR/AcrR family transcriptional regulator n=1 Tax=Arthrobacter sp. Y81 TaxID=2058897 RepID=UPI001CA48AE1|nr:TetR/AcrR family transcriptional regulator [Arthrobacter sp. Y81]